MAFAEDLSLFTDPVAGFSISATLNAVARQVIFDAPGVDAMGGEVVTTEPSCVVEAGAAAAEGQSLVISAVPGQLAHLAGTYSVRGVEPEPPDGAFVRCYLARVS